MFLQPGGVQDGSIFVISVDDAMSTTLTNKQRKEAIIRTKDWRLTCDVTYPMLDYKEKARVLQMKEKIEEQEKDKEPGGSLDEGGRRDDVDPMNDEMQDEGGRDDDDAVDVDATTMTATDDTPAATNATTDDAAAATNMASDDHGFVDHPSLPVICPFELQELPNWSSLSGPFSTPSSVVVVSHNETTLSSRPEREREFVHTSYTHKTPQTEFGSSTKSTQTIVGSSSLKNPSTEWSQCLHSTKPLNASAHPSSHRIGNLPRFAFFRNRNRTKPEIDGWKTTARPATPYFPTRPWRPR